MGAGGPLRYACLTVCGALQTTLKIFRHRALEGVELENRPRPKKFRTPISRKLIRWPPVFIMAIERGPQGGRLCKTLGKFIRLILSNRRSNFWRPTIFVLGAYPQTGSKNLEVFGGISSPYRGLLRDIKMSGIFLKIREILRVKEKPLSPPSGETGNLRLERGPKYSSGSRGLQVLKVW